VETGEGKEGSKVCVEEELSVLGGKGRRQTVFVPSMWVVQKLLIRQSWITDFYDRLVCWKKGAVCSQHFQLLGNSSLTAWCLSMLMWSCQSLRFFLRGR